MNGSIDVFFFMSHEVIKQQACNLQINGKVLLGAATLLSVRRLKVFKKKKKHNLPKFFVFWYSTSDPEILNLKIMRLQDLVFRLRKTLSFLEETATSVFF